MKAIARKINDNEWIAEQRNPYYPYEGNKNHPIVSPSDIEWLEKNNMDGKEVEGETEFMKGLPELTVFNLITPPIHPAGEDKWPTEHDIKWALGHPISHDPREQSMYELGVEEGINWLKSWMKDTLKEDKYFPKPPTPQTGRTYTEGEVDEELKDLLEWYINSTGEVAPLSDTIVKAYRRDIAQHHWTKGKWKEKYINNKP